MRRGGEGKGRSYSHEWAWVDTGSGVNVCGKSMAGSLIQRSACAIGLHVCMALRSASAPLCLSYDGHMSRAGMGASDAVLFFERCCCAID